MGRQGSAAFLDSSAAIRFTTAAKSRASGLGNCHVLHHHEDHPHVVSRNARYGLVLFAVYVALYAGFIALAVFWTPVMAAPVPGGMNVAIAYGFALIAAALVLAFVYMALCRIPVSTHDDKGAR